ncbi:MAG: hypothetical protein IKH73_07945, partial [Erysipelotrichaceae bacterium]|nr:hypothetical protein [Erysipelotrichaceae bacterium]
MTQKEKKTAVKGKNGKITVLAVVAVLIAVGVFWYFALFNLGIHQALHWITLLFIVTIVTSIAEERKNVSVTRKTVIPSTVFIVGLLVILLAGSPLTSLSLYTHQISPQEENFSDAVDEFDVRNVQTLDKTAAQSLGDRTFGTIGAQQISQYSVSDLYTQQVYKGNLVRVTPAEYNGFFTSLNGEGTPGYIIVNVVTGESSFVIVDGGMKYVPSAVFGKDLLRHVRFAYPFEILSSERFEIDETGHPYWIYTTYEAHGFVGHAKVPNGVITCDAVNGNVEKYSTENAPDWIDQIYTASEIINEYRNYGQYQGGLINKFTTKKGVLSTTDDYSYLMQNGQLYMYTGVTSA